MLLAALDPRKERSFDGPDALDRARERGWPACALVSGHFDYTTVQGIDGPSRLVTSLRDPVERAISLYRFSNTITDEEARRINCGMTDFAKNSDESTFFRQASYGVHANFSNAQTRQILGRDWARLAAENAWDQALALAKDRLLAMTGFVIREDFERSCGFMFRQLGLPAGHVHQDNRLSDRMEKGHAIRKSFGSVDDDLLRFLKNVNRIDRALYDFAVEVMDARMARAEAATRNLAGMRVRPRGTDGRLREAGAAG